MKNSNSNTIQLDLHQAYRPNEKIGVHFVQMDIRLDQNHPRRVHEQNPQVAVTSRLYLTEDGAVAGRDLLGNEAQPGGEVAPLGEHVACANRRYHPARDDLPDTGAVAAP
jgi:hypothetical protein